MATILLTDFRTWERIDVTFDFQTEFSIEDWAEGATLLILYAHGCQRTMFVLESRREIQDLRLAALAGEYPTN